MASTSFTMTTKTLRANMMVKFSINLHTAMKISQMEMRERKKKNQPNIWGKGTYLFAGDIVWEHLGTGKFLGLPS